MTVNCSRCKQDAGSTPLCVAESGQTLYFCDRRCYRIFSTVDSA